MSQFDGPEIQVTISGIRDFKVNAAVSHLLSPFFSTTSPWISIPFSVMASSSILLLFLLLFPCARISGLYHEAQALLSFKAAILHDPFGALESWQPSTNPCNWSGVGCHRQTHVTSLEITSRLLEGPLTSLAFANLTRLTGLILQGNNLSGPIPASIGLCKGLQILDLRENNLFGPLPRELAGLQNLEALYFSGNQLSGSLYTIFSSDFAFPNLKIFDFSRNRLSGKLPAALGRCTSLQEIHLEENRLVGIIPITFGDLRNLLCLSLNDNLLAGPLPGSLVGCFRMQILNVANNFLSGSIPSALAAVPGLRYLNVSNNQFHGPIPAGPWLPFGVGVDAFLGNPGLCGRPLDPCNLSTTLSLSLPASAKTFLVFFSQFRCFKLVGRFSQKGQRALWIRGLARMLAVKNSTHGPADSPAPSPAPALESKRKSKNKVKRWVFGLSLGMLAGGASAVFIFLSSNFVINWIKRRKKDFPIIFTRAVSPKLLAFLKKDDGLEGAQLIGEGGAGQVYKAVLENGKIIAIKKVTPNVSDIMENLDQSLVTKNTRQIHAELETLGKVRHRNLVSLLAYVRTSHAHLLIYEYMPNGSLHEVLFRAAEGSVQLTWPIRHNIAVGVAQGLTYLHFHCVPRIVHRDLKPGNILLDDDLEPHLGDFGLASVLPENATHCTSSNLAGTVGYIAPEFHQTLRYTEKCDVYSLGVVLIVLLTGKEPTDDLFLDVTSMGTWVRNRFQSGNATEIFDPKLMGEGFEEEMMLALKIAVFCTAEAPSERPTSRDVLRMLLQVRREK